MEVAKYTVGFAAYGEADLVARTANPTHRPANRVLDLRPHPRALGQRHLFGEVVSSRFDAVAEVVEVVSLHMPSVGHQRWNEFGGSLADLVQLFQV